MVDQSAALTELQAAHAAANGIISCVRSASIFLRAPDRKVEFKRVTSLCRGMSDELSKLKPELSPEVEIALRCAAVDLKHPLPRLATVPERASFHEFTFALGRHLEWYLRYLGNPQEMPDADFTAFTLEDGFDHFNRICDELLKRGEKEEGWIRDACRMGLDVRLQQEMALAARELALHTSTPSQLQAESPVPDNSLLTAPELMRKYDVPPEKRKALDSSLYNWRKKNPGSRDFIENEGRSSREPAFVYRESAVAEIVRKHATSPQPLRSI